ncbi:MAG: DUF2336 domain-containing protein [Alphaproteobacteria bacterium]
MPILSEEDVDKLLKAPTPRGRAEAAAKIGAVHSRPDLTPNERILAESIFRIMMRDTDQRVRAALADSLKDNQAVPHDVAIALARDVEQVAVPMLHYSLVFTDEDLVEIVRSRPAAFQVAVAGRERVSEAVAGALVEHGDEAVVTTLVRNPGAEVTERVGAKIIDLFSGCEVVMDGLAERPSLPLALAERLVTLVSENIRLHLVETHGMLDYVSERVLRLGRERATLDLLPLGAGPGEVDTFIRQLHLKGRLTPSLLARILFTGRMVAFEAGLAQRCGIPRANAHALIHDSGPLGLRSVTRASGLPEGMGEILRVVLGAARTVDPTRDEPSRAAFAKAVLAAIGERMGKGTASDLEGVLIKLDAAQFELPALAKAALATT